MQILYLFRKQDSSYSIEGLFLGLQQYLNTPGNLRITTLAVPQLSQSLGQMWANVQFVRQQVAGQSGMDVYHITGDVHYLALALPAPKTVLTIHDCVSLERQRARGNWLRFGLIWLFFYYLPMRRAATVTTVSDKTKAELARYVGSQLAAKVRVIPNYTDPALAYQSAPFNQQRPVLLQLGTAPHKNLPRLCEALAGLPCHLVLVGELTPAQQRLLQRYQITYTNHRNLSREAIQQHYYACDMVTFVSLYEGFGLPILEANASGRAVLTANRLPMQAVAANAAELVDPTDVVAIRRGIERLIQDEAHRNQLIANGLQNAQRYSIGNIASQYTALYAALTAHH